MDIKTRLKKTGIVNRILTEKWKKRSRAGLFSPSKAAFLEQHPEKIKEALRKRLEEEPDLGEATMKALREAVGRSPLSGKTGAEKESLETDMLFWHYAFGFTFCEYLGYHFSEIEIPERHGFLSEKDGIQIGYDVNDLREMHVLSDKSETYQSFRRYYRREAFTVASEKDLGGYLEFIEKHPRFVAKLTREACGRSVRLVELSDTKEAAESFFREILSQGKTILEEVVVQSGILAGFNASSVNTVRCITFRNQNGVTVPFTFLKTGRAGAFIDNGAAGGILVAVDEKTGVLGQGTDEFGNRFSEHPDSGLKFEGFRLPDWEEMLRICCEMSEKLPALRLIGWDMAHTEEGWVLIEGNHLTEMIGPQSTTLKGIRRKMETLCAEC
ncbi:MAG: hypothetical protein IKG97_05845 [Lachnospiraceae bacterium]|nr:hypothetical protein [Lachnospiraceae bacterium]